ncbi:response regulator [Aquabacterium fontiphilum]|uniref:response regulator transcription factor n=1 Tax=Aquabacterium fontiphilum TaxID=450365 RepID=UPI0013775A6D|nr:response regulator [Aquabacterium fontiphilum]
MHVLVIEDDRRVSDFLSRGLRAEGHQVEVCHDAATGLQRACAWASDMADQASVVLLDRMLPGTDGAALCSALRERGVTLPILMLTALGSTDDKVHGLRAGADDYLVKPFAFDELLARIEALARRSRTTLQAPDPVLQIADLVLHRDTMRVTRAGQPLNLTARELALLELLMSSPGKLLSRERILSRVWGAHADPLTNVVDVYIRRLRVKVDEGREPPLIHTVRGLGYRLEPPA